MSSRWARVAGAISRGMARSPVGLSSCRTCRARRTRSCRSRGRSGSARDRRDPAVDVDLDGGPVAEVVQLMDLVHVGDQERHLARLDEDGAVLLERGVAVAVAIVDAAEAGLLDGVAHHADHAPGLMVVRADVLARPPHDARDRQPRPTVQEVAAAARAPPAHGGPPVLLGHRLRVAHQPLDQTRPAVEESRLVGLSRHQVGHVVDELVERVFGNGHGRPPLAAADYRTNPARAFPEAGVDQSRCCH